MGITEFIIEWALHLIDTIGYLGIAFLMMLESMIAPVPSEAVMPPAGMLIASGQLTWFGVILSATIGSVVGSLIGYYMGKWGGRPFVERFGKYLLLDKHDLDITENFFNKKGEATIFFCRFIPVVRHFISIPAGIGRMNLGKFILYTTIGATIWNTILTIAGFYLQKNWEVILKYREPIDLGVIFLLILVFGYFGVKFFKNRRKKKI
ncbi:MAG: DedA family protein [Bacteroidetes bacterium]|nr:DedA family protein [Bacteroidota bacterium]